MKNEEVLKNCIVLTGPMSVGKSLISSELSKRTGMECVSIDDILGFAYAELYSGLFHTPEYIDRFYKVTLNDELKHQRKRYPNKSVKELEKEIIKLIDRYIEEYLRLRNILGTFEEIYPIIDKYYRIFSCCPNLNADTNLVLTQEKCAKVLNILSKNLKEPTIIDTPAYLGWKIPDFNFPQKDTTKLAKMSYRETPQSVEKTTSEVLNKFGAKVFLTPGIDYNKRHKIDCESNFIMNDLIDQFSEYADIEVSVNNLFYDEKDDALKIREWFDAESYKKRNQIKNNSEISNICETILSLVEDLNNQKAMQ